MVEIVEGNILRAEAEALVNTVNCVGVMGRGIALQFKKKYPKNYEAYKAACHAEAIEPGKMFVFDLNSCVQPFYIINFPTKRHWKNKSRLVDIETGLAALVTEVRRRGVHSIAVPPLGCGLGGLDWNEVRLCIETAFSELPAVQVLLYAPSESPAAALDLDRAAKPRMTAGRAALLGLMRRYLSSLMDVSVSLLEIHKLMYFMQEAGEPLRLGYVKGFYGPYAENLRHVLSRMEGHFIKGYEDGDEAPDKQIELKNASVRKAGAFLEGHPDTRARFERVADLIEGFETPYGLELLASVHWVSSREDADSLDEAINKTCSWNNRKQEILKADHIKIAWEVLHEKQWLPKLS